MFENITCIRYFPCIAVYETNFEPMSYVTGDMEASITFKGDGEVKVRASVCVVSEYAETFMRIK